MPAVRAPLANAALCAITLLVIAAGLRDAPGIGSAAKRLRPAAGALGLDQNWSVFAPQPRTYGLRFEAVVRWSDGRRTVWRVPAGDPLIGAYRDYRWRKWAENASSDRLGAGLWRPAALYVVRRLPGRPDAAPVELSFVRYTQQLSPPGTRASPPWRGVEVYRARLGVDARGQE